MHAEARSGPDAAAAAPELLKLLVRVALRLQQGAAAADPEWRGWQYNGGRDPAAAEVWRSGGLLTHEAQRGAADLASVHRTAEFVWRVVERCGKEPGGASHRP